MLAIAKKEQSTETTSIESLRARADAYQSEGRYGKAEPLLRQALALAEKNFGRDHLEVSATLNNLGVLYKCMARLAEAGQLYQRALEITEKALGPDHTEVATIYHNLGGLEHASGNYARGEQFARRAVKIRERALGPDNTDVAADIAALATVLDGQKKYSEAERLYRRALAIYKRHYGPEHYEIAINLNNLAAIYHAKGKPEKAEELYQRALAIKEKLLGPDHPDVATSLNNLAVLYKRERRYGDAEPLYRRALATFERALGAEHPKVATCLENYAQLLRKFKREAEALELEARREKTWNRIDRLNEDNVAVTTTINPEFACFRLAVRSSEIHRWGVYAEEPIPPGRKVIEYTGERISSNRIRQGLSPSLIYLFKINDYWSIDGASGSGAEFVNHSCEPNLYAKLVKGHILYMSKRRIEPGEELTADYKFSPHVEKFPCHCGSARCRGTINLSNEQFAKRARRSNRREHPNADVCK